MTRIIMDGGKVFHGVIVPSHHVVDLIGARQATDVADPLVALEDLATNLRPVIREPSLALAGPGHASTITRPEPVPLIL